MSTHKTLEIGMVSPYLLKRHVENYDLGGMIPASRRSLRHHVRGKAMPLICNGFGT